MSDQRHTDVLIIGGGPAGLCAARAAASAGSTVILLEKLASEGDLGHPCSGAIAPVPGFVQGRRTPDGIHFPELHFTIPTALIVGAPTVQRYISPGGIAFEAVFPDSDEFPIAVIDKSGVLRLLAAEARAAGAELRYGSAVTGLLREGGRVFGARTHHEEIRAQVVIAAEGVSRQFTGEAGLYDEPGTDKRYAFIVSEALDAPAATAADVVQISTLGKRYTSVSTPAFGTVIVPTAGRAEVYFSVFADAPRVHTDESLWHYLEEYKRDDPRISHLLQGATRTHRAGTRMVLRATPPHVVRQGFVGVGDSVGPGGHVGILPCMFLGQEAGRTAAQAVASGDASRARLADYETRFHTPILRGLDTEYRIITSLSEMSDEELDRLCQTLSRVNLAPFFFGEWQPLLSATLRWVVTGLPLILRDWRLIQRMMSGG